MFMSAVPPEIRGRCFTHFTCATDTGNIKKIFEDVKNGLTTKNSATAIINP